MGRGERIMARVNVRIKSKIGRARPRMRVLAEVRVRLTCEVMGRSERDHVVHTQGLFLTPQHPSIQSNRLVILA